MMSWRPAVWPVAPDRGDVEELYPGRRARLLNTANYGAQRASIYVVGRFDEKAVKKAIEASFGGWSKGPVRADAGADRRGRSAFRFRRSAWRSAKQCHLWPSCGGCQVSRYHPARRHEFLAWGLLWLAASRPTSVSRKAIRIPHAVPSRKAMEPTSGQRTPPSPPQPRVRQSRKL